MARDEEPLSLDDEDRPRKKRRRRDEGDDRPKKGLSAGAAVAIVAGVLGAFVVAVLALGAVFGGGKRGEGRGAAVASSEQPAPAATYTAKTFDEFFDEYQGNAAATAEKYAQNGVEFRARIASMSDHSGYLLVYIRGDMARFDREAGLVVRGPALRDAVKKGKAGGELVIKARTDGKASFIPGLIADDIRVVD